MKTFVRKISVLSFAALALVSIYSPPASAQIGPSSGGVVIGAPIVGTCTSGYDLYNNGGVVGCQTDAGTGTVTSVSVATANGVSGSVANPTTTPAITLTLGAITPSSAAIGAGSAITSSGPGGALASGAFATSATEHVSFQPGLVTSVTNTKGAFYKFSKASTVDNIEASANSFSCTGNPTVTMYECGTSASCSSSPTSIGAATVVSAGTVVDGTVSSAAIAAGDYVAFAISAGTCVTLDIQATAQIHQN